MDVEILLTQGKVAVIDDRDLPIVAQGTWSLHRAKGSKTLYAIGRLPGNPKKILMHRLLMGFPDGQVDHRDHDGLNNRRSNLRVADNITNHQNSPIRSDNTSGFKGVSWEKRRSHWVARIHIDTRQVHLGSFSTAEQAARAYDAAARKAFGEFASLNFKERVS
jgi:hypothetical protein